MLNDALLRNQVANLIYFCTTQKRKINEIQTSLVASLSFTVSALFRCIASSGHGHITFIDLQQLFRRYNKSLVPDDFYFLCSFVPRRSKERSFQRSKRPEKSFITYEQFLDMIRPVNIPVFQLRVTSASTRSLYEHVPENALSLAADVLEGWTYFFTIKRLVKEKLQAEYGFYCTKAFSGSEWKSHGGVDYHSLKHFMNSNSFAFDQFDFKLLLDDMHILGDENIKISLVDFFKYISPDEEIDQENQEDRGQFYEKSSILHQERTNFAKNLRSNVGSPGIMGHESKCKPVDCNLLMTFQTLGQKYTTGDSKYPSHGHTIPDNRDKPSIKSLFNLPPSSSPSEIMNPLNKILISSIDSSIQSRNNRPFIDPMDQNIPAGETPFDRYLSGYYRQLGLREKLKMYSKMVSEEEPPRDLKLKDMAASPAKFYRDQLLKMQMIDSTDGSLKPKQMKGVYVGPAEREKTQKVSLEETGKPVFEEKSLSSEDGLLKYFKKKRHEMEPKPVASFNQKAEKPSFNESGWFRHNGFESMVLDVTRQREETPLEEIDLNDFSEINVSRSNN